jgi:Na+/melibiose symporter-like transporter
MRERRLRIDTEKKDEDFFRVLKQAMKQRNFQALIILRVAYLTSYNIFVSTISFWIIYVLNLDLTANIIPMMLFILGGPITIPLWLKIGKKANAKIMFVLGFLIIIVCAIPMMFIDSLIGTAIVFAILGAGAGCQAVFGLLIFSDTIEEAAIITGTRQEGIYIGINIFFIRTSIALQVFIVGIVLLITGFNPKATIQAPEALLGIRLLMSIIPGSILLTGVILFWILFNITPEKRLATQAKLKELGL